VTYFLIAGLFIVVLTVQTSVLALAGQGAVYPDLLLLTVIALALLSDARRGVLLGCAAGLLQDIVFAAPLGFFAFGKALAGLAAGMLAREIHRDYLLSPVLIAMLLTVVVEVATFLLQYLLFTISPLFVTYLSEVVLPRTVLHTLLMAVLYPLCYRLQKKALLFAASEH